MKLSLRSAIVAMAVALPSALAGQVRASVGDVDFKFKFGGRTNLDLGTYMGANDGMANRNGASVNDTRMSLIADVDTLWQVKIELSFGSRQVSFRDLFIKRTFKNTNSEIQLGNILLPFGLFRQGIGYKFIEIAPADNAYTPGRKLGAAYTKYLPRFNWSVGFYSDGAIDNGQQTNRGYSFMAHGLVRPVDNGGTIFHIGATGLFTHPSSAVTFNAITPHTFSTGSTKTLFSTPGMEAYNYGRLNVNALTIVRRFYAEAHFMKAWVNRPNETNVTTDGETRTMAQGNYNDSYGVYVQAAWRIMGENHSYNRKTGLTGNANGRALEVLARFSQLDLDTYGAVNDVTIGMNYFINRYLRLKVNYVHSHIRGGADLDHIQGRFQFSF